MQKETIYIELLDEGVRLFAPIPAEHLGGRYYKILEHHRADYGVLRFEVGTYMLCLLTKLSAGNELVPLAYCAVDKEETEHMSSSLS